MNYVNVRKLQVYPPLSAIPLDRRSGSEEKAIQLPSGDQAGLKSLPRPDVSGVSRPVLRWRIHKSAVPSAWVLTKTSFCPSGEKSAWSSYAGLAVSRWSPVPSGLTR